MENETKVKKQKQEAEQEKEQVLDIQADINSLILNQGDLTIDDNFDVLSTNIDVLDAYLGGGVAQGGFLQIVGSPGSGKSLLASKVLAAGQQQYGNNFMCLYLDSEESMSKDRLAQLGIKRPEIIPITDLTVEKVFSVIKSMHEYKMKNSHLIQYPSVIVWDSIANTITDRTEGLEEVDPAKVMGLRANLLSQFLPDYIKKMKKSNITLVAINQLRDKIEMGRFPTKSTLKYLANKNIPGGNSLLHNSTQLVLLSSGKDIADEYGFPGGNIVSVKLVKNKLFRPNLEFNLVFSFSLGYSKFWSNYELLKTYGRVKAAAWCTLQGVDDVKFRQKDAITNYKNNEAFRNAFDENVRDVIKTEITEKNVQALDPELEGIF